MNVYRLDRRGSIEHLRRHEEDTPAPQRGEVLVRVRAVSLNFRDLAMADGRFFADAPAGLVPVSDAAGEIAAVGEGVTRFAVGDRVINVFNPRWFGGPYPGTERHQYGTAQDGWLAEYKVVSEEHVVDAPAGLTFEQASTLPCAAVTAWSAVTGPNPVTSLDTVLVQGTGGVSLFALQLAKRIGARVIAMTSSAAKAARLTELGADEVVDYRANPDWGRRVRELAGSRGVDRIVEVGGSTTFAESLRAGHENAELALVGFLGDEDWKVGFWDLFGGGFATLRKVRVGSRQDTEDLLHFLDRHPIEPVIDSVHSFDDAMDAWRRLDSGQAVGKVLITV